MVKVDAGEHNYYLDGYLKANMDYMIKDVKKRNFDGFILITGREGYGKSTLAMQLAKYVDPKFDIDRVCFTADQFLEAVETVPKYSSIVFDETMGYLSSRGAMSKFNKVLIKVMSEMRSKNLFVFMCIPNLFMMDWYVAQHRTTGLLYVPERATFNSYDYPTKKRLYMKGKKEHDYCVPPNFYGRFVKYFPLDAEAYEKKKQTAINEWTAGERLESKAIKGRNRLIAFLVHSNLMNQVEVAEKTGLTQASISKILKEFESNTDIPLENVGIQ